MTHWGTNTFILGEGQVAVVDPGPRTDAHLEAILIATIGEEITDILVTHPHADHSALAHTLAERTGAKIYAMTVETPDIGFPDLGGGEGLDPHFTPDRQIRDGETVAGNTWAVRALHTPGHFSSHVAFDIGNAVLTGDHVFEWASTFISPPHGSVSAFMASCERLLDLADRPFLPSHGEALKEPADRLSWLMEHRRAREHEILTAVTPKPVTLDQITMQVYQEIPHQMLPAAKRNVLAHLVDLLDRNELIAAPDFSLNATFHRP